MARRDSRHLNGVLLLDKPLGISSNDALQQVRRLFNADKAGHTGTLDPNATGLLPICFGEATKFSNVLLGADKNYDATLRLGETTTTGDSEGDIVEVRAVEVKRCDVDRVFPMFRGEITQLPPMHSALKHQGKPLYEYIRKGITIERQRRPVVVHELHLNYLAESEMDITVRCSSGTYVRTLAEDIGSVLGCGAHLIALRRTAIAHFEVGSSHRLQELREMTEPERDACILPMEDLMPNMPRLRLQADQVRRLSQGQQVGIDVGLPNGAVCLQGEHGFIGVGLVHGSCVAPARLLSDRLIQGAQKSHGSKGGVEKPPQ
jgi:tRNA pseudouridine55 synthase